MKADKQLLEEEIDDSESVGHLELDGLGTYVFHRQKTIVIPEGTIDCLIDIEESPNLEAIELPASLEKFRFNIDKAPRLKRIAVDPANPNYKTVGERALVDKRTDNLALGLGYIPEDPELNHINAWSLLTYEDEDLVIPKTVHQMHGGKNLHCRRVILEGTTYIHPSFFLGDKLEEVVIKGAATIFPFGYASNTKGIRHRLTFTILEPNSTYRYEDGGLFANDKLLVGSFDDKGRPIIPPSTKVIGDYAFYGVKAESIGINDGVKQIGDFAFCLSIHPSYIWIGKGLRRLGFVSFLPEWDSQLQIRVSMYNPYLYERHNCLIDKKTDTLLFGGPNGQIAEGVKRLAKGAFPCAPHDIYLPQTLKSLPPKAFFAERGIHSVYLNHRLRVGEGAFHGNGKYRVYLGKDAFVAPSFFKEGFKYPVMKDNVFLSVGNPNYAIKDGQLLDKDGNPIDISE